MRWGNGSAGRSLRNRNFRIYYLGQLASVCGTWCQTVALAWLVLDRTGSGASLGLLTACQFLPVILLGAWSGVVADRFDNRRAVLAVQSLLGVQAAALAVVVLLDISQLWVLFALAGLQGVGTAFDTPTRQSLVGQLVPREDLANALALNGGLVQLARIIGPVAAAGLIALFGAGLCFAVNSASYVVVVFAVALIRISDRPTSERRQIRVRDGFVYAWTSGELRPLLVLALASATAATTVTVVLPVLINESLGGGATMYGMLAACQGVGALVGAATLASRVTTTRRHVIVSFAIAGASMAAVALSPYALFAVAPLLGVGFGSFTTGVTLNSSLQLGARLDMRGRIIAMYFLITFGSNAIFGPVFGVIADAVSARGAFLLSAAILLATASVLTVRWRDEYGLPPVPNGV